MTTTNDEQLPPRLVEIKQRYGGTVREADKTYVVQGDDLAWLIAEVELSVSRRAASHTEQAQESQLLELMKAAIRRTEVMREERPFDSQMQLLGRVLMESDIEIKRELSEYFDALAASPVEDEKRIPTTNERCVKCGHGRICFDEDYQACMFIVGSGPADRFCACRCDFSRLILT